jgi:hypothetical protein
MNVLRGVVDIGTQLLGGVKDVGGAMLNAAAAGAHAGPPVIGKFQEARADKKWEALNGADKETFGWLMDRAGSPAEQAYLRKALASGHSVEQIEQFADQIRGKSEDWLRANLHLTSDVNAAPGLIQQWNDSCGPTTAQVVRGEMDPIYSLSVHTGNADITKPDPRANVTVQDLMQAAISGRPLGDLDVAIEQRSILQDHGGTAVERGKSGGGGMSLPPALNTFSDSLGVTYDGAETVSTSAHMGAPGTYLGMIEAAWDQKAVSQNSAALAKLDADLANGIPGALRLSNPSGSGGHFVAVTGSIDGPPKQYMLHDPWSGTTVYMKASDLQQGNIVPAVAGWTRLTHVYTSKPD